MADLLEPQTVAAVPETPRSQAPLQNERKLLPNFRGGLLSFGTSESGSENANKTSISA